MTSGIYLADQDPEVRPQDDLFLHANGRWLRENEIPGDRARYGTFDMLRERSESDCHEIVEDLAQRRAGLDDTERKVADLYAGFMDVDRVESAGVTPLRPFLDDVAALTSTAEVMPLLGRWLRDGVMGAVVPFVNTDDRDSDRYVVYLEQAGLGLPDESYYREEAFEPIRTAYVPHVERMLDLAGVPDAPAAAARVMALETELAAHHWDRVACRDAVRTYNKLTLDELAERSPAVDWRAWVTALGGSLEAVEEVVVRQPSYAEALSTALAGRPLEEWQDWLRWHAVHEFAPYLPSAFVEENFAFYGRTLSGMPQLRERWKRGVALVEAAMGEALGRAYVERHFPPVAKERMEILVGNLVEAFRRDFETLDWMSPETRKEALAKLERFVPKIGHPQEWRDYSALVVDPSDLVGTVRRASAFELDRNLAKLGGPVDRSEWFMTPQTVNAYYNPGLNEIVFPAAILQPPFFDVEADDAVNYGSIGAVIGHEIGHGFDDQGSRYDGDGNLRDWWTAEDRERFDARSQALIAQFDTQEPIEAPGHTVNGALTVGENIGDLGGLTIGHAAYLISTEDDGEPPVLDGLTGSQRFFLGWAQVWKGKARPEEAVRLLAIDPHAPQNCRSNVARNLDEFHAAFGAVEGDGMWLPPGERVRIF
ncbi:putative peptidase [Nostocoides japonicum T1-X7]|uniref:Putative peptidase n=1 Tax=Nostocoides japonicum T1-X7 TaxID=1194083 RepID=A0A077LZ99_9MICO|nr:M13-type metalloendopeptidase [Tetrasphaera japonica]CCH77325.1 putative peptidase [Tetrasphaera japonica T1-X7]